LKNQEPRDAWARAFCELKRLDLRSASLLPKVPLNESRKAGLLAIPREAGHALFSG
jgi:hypothetical protein